MVAATAFAICTLILGVEFTTSELLELSVAALVCSFACTSFGLCLGSLGFRGRNVTFFADMIAGAMLIVSGANVLSSGCRAGCRR